MTTTPEFEIRMAEKDDTLQILDIYAPFIDNTAVSFEYEIPAVEEYWNRIKAVMAEAPWLVCVSLSDQRIAGFAYAGKHRKREAYMYSRELSVYVETSFRKNNIATALYTSLIGILKHQGYANALAGITLPNEPSIKFHEKMGFSKVGDYTNVGYKFGRFYTVSWMERQINNKISGNIKPLKKVLNTEYWSAAINEGLKLIR